MLRSKYKVDKRIPDSIECGRCSSIWRGVARVWDDPWIPNIGPLKLITTSPEQPHFKCTLKDMVAVDGTWDLLAFRHVPENIIKKIINIPPPRALAGRDRLR